MADQTLEAFGERVRAGRKREGLRQEDLAGKVGISRTYLSQIEQGRATNLSLRLANALSKELGIDPPSEDEDTAPLPTSLKAFAEEEDLPQADVDMLRGLVYRGQRPEKESQWRILYNLIKTTIRES